MGNLTEVERERWKKIRKRVYLPEDVDEYNSSSSVLNEITRAGFSDNKSEECSPLKAGYVADLCSDGGIAPCALILGLLYVKRLSQINPKYLHSVSPTDLFLTTMVVASKYLQDEGEMEALVNSEWAEIGQRSKSTVDALEKDFLAAMDWRLFVTQDEYYDFAASLQARVAATEAGRRGWWSYTDLAALWEGSDTPQMMMDAGKQTVKVTSGGMAAYLTCLTMLMAATHLVHVTMDTPANTQLSSNVDQGRPLTLLHRVDMDSDWKELMIDFPGTESIWKWYGTGQHHTSTQAPKDYLALENQPQFTCDTFPSGGPSHIRHGAVTSAFGTHTTAGNRTTPLIPLDHYEHCQGNYALDTGCDGFLHEFWPCYQSHDPGINNNNYSRRDHTRRTFGTGSPESDLITSNNSELGVTRMDVSNMRIVVCRGSRETGLLWPVCSLPS